MVTLSCARDYAYAYCTSIGLLLAVVLSLYNHSLSGQKVHLDRYFICFLTLNRIPQPSGSVIVGELPCYQ